MPKQENEANLPPIPDGGLSESMPEWLRRPPAWRTLNDTEVVQTTPDATTTLPEPDTSVIDPRAFLTDEDLPRWLRGLGQARPTAPTPGDDEPVATIDVRGSREPPAPESPGVHALTPARFVPRQPNRVERPTGPTLTTTRPVIGRSRGKAGSVSPWWQGAPVVVMLGTLLLIAIVVIAVLVA